MLKNIKNVLVCGMVLMLGAMLLVGCDEPEYEDPKTPSISVAPSSVMANVGEDVQFTLTFSNFETVPETVTVSLRKSGDTDSVNYTLKVENGKITIPTDRLTAGTYTCFVNYGNGFFEITLQQKFSNIVQLTATQSTKYANTVNVSWKITEKINDSLYLAYTRTNDNSNVQIKDSDMVYSTLNSQTGKYEGEYNVELKESGTYYFWLYYCEGGSSSEKRFSSSASCSYAHNKTYFTAVQSETDYNKIEVCYLDPQEFSKYKLYYNTTNSTASAQYVTLDYSSGIEKSLRELLFNSEKTGFYNNSHSFSFKTSGTYYFWIKKVDSLGYESEFSEPVSCTFTYARPSAPTNVTAVKQANTGNLKITWEDSKKATYYNIYYSKTNDSSTATQYSGNISIEATKAPFTGEKEIYIADTGTIYIWIKGIDSPNNVSGDFSQVISVEN